ncbi:MAG: peptidoglycan-binding protein LysM [Flavobacteriaceae bacterium]|nr:peptidoglycan-binding protein LysM [Flavobacteriaceae bacterium]
MKKRYTPIALSGLIFISFTLFGNSELLNQKKVQYNLPVANSIATVSKDIKPFNIIYTPNVDNAFIGFREALAFKESQGKYDKINTLGYIGKYQFGKSTLHRIKIYDTKAFINDPALQEKAFIALSSLNKWILIRDIKRSVGKSINGIEITESGILAAAHLAGAGNVKKYLRSNGELIFTDAYGSDVQYYMKKFAGYDTSFISPIKNASI